MSFGALVMGDQACANLARQMMRGAELVKVERTENIGLVNSMLALEGIRETVWDDSGPAPLPLHPGIYYLIASMDVWDEGAVNECAIGCMAFMPVNAVTWNPHIAILPKYRGKGTQAMKSGIVWMFEHTPCKKLVAYPPEYNKPMVRVFEKCGFDHEGFSPDSILKNGLLHGRNLMGRNK